MYWDRPQLLLLISLNVAIAADASDASDASDGVSEIYMSCMDVMRASNVY